MVAVPEIPFPDSRSWSVASQVNVETGAVAAEAEGFRIAELEQFPSHLAENLQLLLLFLYGQSSHRKSRGYFSH